MKSGSGDDNKKNPRVEPRPPNLKSIDIYQ